jgi:SAM-dependent methyltransferase
MKRLLARLLSRVTGHRTDALLERWLRHRRRARHPARFGAAHGLAPLSEHWGRDRGTPLDRLYIEAFLAAHAVDIRGDVLEVKDATYTNRFGTGVRRSDVLDVDSQNEDATIIADLTHVSGVNEHRFDCFILTQTLQYVFDVRAAVEEAWRVLRPGGTVLCTVPSIIRIDRKAGPDRDFWRFTPGSCHRLFDPVFGPDRVEVTSHGNVLVACAFLMGAAAEELSPRERETDDERFPIVITIRAVKGAAEHLG